MQRMKNQFSSKFQIKTCKFHKWKSAALLLLRFSFSPSFFLPRLSSSSLLHLHISPLPLQKALRPNREGRSSNSPDYSHLALPSAARTPTLFRKELRGVHALLNPHHPESPAGAAGPRQGWEALPGLPFFTDPCSSCEAASQLRKRSHPGNVGPALPPPPR